MSFLQWDSGLDVGVKKMNDQHKVLIDLMNKLHADHKTGVGKVEQLKTANELVRLAIKHFREEERYMESINYDGIASHKRIHASLEKSLAEHLREVERPGGRFTDDFFYFLRSWLKAHIAGIDTKYSGLKS